VDETSDIEWLRNSLWPGSEDEPGSRRTISYLANPSPTDCRLLIPTASRRAAAQSVRRYHNGASTRARLVMSVTELGLRIGASSLLSGRQVRLQWERKPGFIAAIEEGLGVSIAHVAFTLGPRRANRKPVAQLFDETGATIGFAKLGVDGYTDQLVRTEADWLNRVARANTLALRAPRPLWAGESDVGEVSVLEPVWATRRPPRDPRRISAALLRDVHQLTPPHTGLISDTSAFAALAIASEPEASAALGALNPDSLEATTTMQHGAWHGDLTPWNILTNKHGPSVIDWETAEGGMPVGLDLLNAATGAAMQLDHADPSAALAAATERIPAMVAGLQLTPAQGRATMTTLLLEFVRRDLDLARVGRPQSGLGAASLRRLQAIES
jgi:hypothetical protein